MVISFKSSIAFLQILCYNIKNAFSLIQVIKMYKTVKPFIKCDRFNDIIGTSYTLTEKLCKTERI